MKAAKVIELLERWISKDLIDSWDNTGFQIGSLEKEVNKVLIGLDLDEALLNRALEGGYDMIITHHPLIFKPITEINSLNYKGRLIMDLIKNDIVVYNAHSNLDIVEGGVNDCLANLLGLKDREVLSPTDKVDGAGNPLGYGRIGTIERIEFQSFIELIKTRLNIKALKVYGHIKDYVERVALCGGSGSSFILDAYRHGAQVYITGDIKYHDAQLAHELGLTLIDGGHYHTEKLVLPAIRDYLDEEVGGRLKIDLIMESGLPECIF